MMIWYASGFCMRWSNLPAKQGQESRHLLCLELFLKMEDTIPSEFHLSVESNGIRLQKTCYHNTGTCVNNTIKVPASSGLTPF